MSDRWPVHTVVFDLDDTLYPERDYVLSGFDAVGIWLEREHGIVGFAAVARAQFDYGLRGRIFDETLVHLGVKDSSALVPRLVEIYRDHLPAISLPVETVAMLNWAKSRFRLALISDGYFAVQERKVTALGLAQWIECVVLSDRWGREAWKPNERAYREVMFRLPGESQGYVYVADNPRKDFIAPRRLGWHTVRLRRKGGEHATYEPGVGEAAELQLENLAQVQRLLESAVRL